MSTTVKTALDRVMKLRQKVAAAKKPNPVKETISAISSAIKASVAAHGKILGGKAEPRRSPETSKRGGYTWVKTWVLDTDNRMAFYYLFQVDSGGRVVEMFAEIRQMASGSADMWSTLIKGKKQRTKFSYESLDVADLLSNPAALFPGAKAELKKMGVLSASVVSASNDFFKFLMKEYLDQDLKHDLSSGEYIPTAGVLSQREEGRQVEEIVDLGKKLFKNDFRHEIERNSKRRRIGVWVTHYSAKRGTPEREEKMQKLAEAAKKAGYKTRVRDDEYVILFDQKAIKDAPKVHGKYLKELAKKGSRGARKSLGLPTEAHEKPATKDYKPAHKQEEGDVVYEVVGLSKNVKAKSKKELIQLLKKAGIKPKGIYSNPRTRAELQGQPTFEGLLGPMYNGPGKIRYETQEAYNQFSASREVLAELKKTGTLTSAMCEPLGMSLQEFTAIGLAGPKVIKGMTQKIIANLEEKTGYISASDYEGIPSSAGDVVNEAVRSKGKTVQFRIAKQNRRTVDLKLVKDTKFKSMVPGASNIIRVSYPDFEKLSNAGAIKASTVSAKTGGDLADEIMSKGMSHPAMKAISDPLKDVEKALKEGASRQRGLKKAGAGNTEADSVFNALVMPTVIEVQETAEAVVKQLKTRIPDRHGVLKSTVSAAKDTGTPKKDKSRQADLEDVIGKAAALREAVDCSAFPEVETACKAVDSLAELASGLREAQVKLKAAKAKTEEAMQAQQDIDDLRARIDSMMTPLKATMDTMETLVLAAAALAEQFDAMQQQAEEMETKLNGDKDRLAAIAKAVSTTAKMA